jgi:UDP-galactopyranose mutase
MLDHPLITVALGTDLDEVRGRYHYDEIVYTGPIDAFFGHRFGRLPYRSLEFRHETFPVERYQPTGTVNYPGGEEYTRVTEFKYLTGQVVPEATSVVFEYPRAEGDPYYPIPRPENRAIYERYAALAGATSGVHFVGRLATYRYYNMDQCVAQALATFRRIASREGLESIPREEPVAAAR